MNLIEKIISEAIEKKNLFFHGGNLDYFEDEIIIPKKGKYEYGFGLYLTSSRKIADSYSKGSRKLYLVELENNIVDLNDVYIDVNEVNQNLKTILSKADFIKMQAPIKRVSDRFDGQINLGTLNILMINNEILKPKYGKSIIDFFISKGADAYIDYNTFGWHETTVVLFNFKKIKNIEKLDRNDENYFNDFKYK